MNAKKLSHLFSQFEFVDPIGPVSEAQINAAEQELGIVLPPQYRSFLANFGGGGIESEDFIGLGGADHLDIVKLRERLRGRNNPLPSHLLPIGSDGFGNYDCIDTTKPTREGEFAIVQWNHEAPSQEPERVADCFDEWLLLIVEMIKAN